MKNILILAAVLLCGCQSKTDLDLSGRWSFALDLDDRGVAEKWYERSLADTILLPGSLQEQGYGNDVSVNTQWTGQIIDRSWFDAPEYAKYRKEGNVKVPFWLQPDKHYVGVAWYQRKVKVPESWKGQFVELELERVHWGVTLYVNGKEVAQSTTLLTPCRFPVKETGELTLTLRVDNRMIVDVGINAHSVSDHTQSNWNGIVGKISLSARPKLHIAAVRVFPDVKTHRAMVELDLAGGTANDEAVVTLRAHSFNSARKHQVKPVTVTTSTDALLYKFVLDMGDDMLTWSEFEPNLYRLDVELQAKSGTDRRSIDFGMREFKAEGKRFAVNGVPVFLRGTLECAIFPLTGYPPTDTAYWNKIYRQCKAYGLNHVRFHSWCPPEAAFIAADHAGVYLQVECGGWTNVGDGQPQDRWVMDESERVVREYGNHPSFCMMLYGNEPFGDHRVDYLAAFVKHWRDKDSRRVYYGGAGWPNTPPDADFEVSYKPRIHGDRGGMSCVLNAELPRTDYDWRDYLAGKTHPVVSHEIGQWCVYPNLKEIPKYTGVLKAKNFEIFKETLDSHHLGDLADKFLYASGRLQTLCYKADIEAALRTPGFAGFQLLDIHDFPGQGSALVGVLDPFWDSKGYVEGAEYSRFCNSIVPLARINKLILTNDETFHADVELSNFSGKTLNNISFQWEITDASGKQLAKGSTAKDLPITNCIPLTEIDFPLADVAVPAQLTLSVTAPSVNAANSWHFWVYPADKLKPQPAITFTANLNDAIAKAKAGATVLCCLSQAALKPEKGGNITVGFSPIFWNTAWFPYQSLRTLGVYCDPAHPALAAFPNEGHSDYQWWEVVTGASAIVMDDFPADFRPLVYHIDDWFTNRRLGLLFECKLGAGKLMVCGADIAGNIDARPAARQFRRSLEQYMMSEKFAPKAAVDEKTLMNLVK